MAGILLVDDHHIARHTVRNLLSAHALSICGEAEDGRQALDQVKALDPDLVLLDINMPVMNGIAAAFEIRRIAPATKILFLTVQDCTPEAEAAAGCGRARIYLQILRGNRADPCAEAPA